MAKIATKTEVTHYLTLNETERRALLVALNCSDPAQAPVVAETFLHENSVSLRVTLENIRAALDLDA